MHAHGLAAVLNELHNELDAAVLEAYGWQDLGWRPAGPTRRAHPWVWTNPTRWPKPKKPCLPAWRR
ncbi:MAG: hypothetical protein U1E47_05055 [Rivihabitans pingtungensis]